MAGTYRLVHIQTFFDGNGRTARFLMNLLLMQQGYPLVNILKNDRKKYYAVLEKADRGNSILLVRFIAQAVEFSMDLYLKALVPTQSKKSKFQPLSHFAKRTTYSEKYLSLLVRQDKVAAHKKGRKWFSSLEAVEDYTAQRKRKRNINRR